MLTILRLATQKEELRIVNDQFGSPTWSREIAAATASILSSLSRGAMAWIQSQRRARIYHLTAAGETTWCQFAGAILKEASRDVSNEDWFMAATRHQPLLVRRVVPIATFEYPTSARRPAYSVLSNERLRRALGFDRVVRLASTTPPGLRGGQRGADCRIRNYFGKTFHGSKRALIGNVVLPNPQKAPNRGSEREVSTLLSVTNGVSVASFTGRQIANRWEFDWRIIHPPMAVACRSIKGRSLTTFEGE